MATPLIDKMPSSKKAVRIVQDQNVEILSRLDAIEARIEQADQGNQRQCQLSLRMAQISKPERKQ